MGTNTNAPFGFVPLRYISGEGTPTTNLYGLNNANSNNIGLGDALKVAGGADINGNMLVDLAAGSDVVVGICGGFQYQPSGNLSPIWSPNWVASTSVVSGSIVAVFVYDDPRIVYKAQINTGATFTSTKISYNADLSTGTPSTVTGVSAQSLGGTNFGTTNTYGFKILRLWGANDMQSGTYNPVSNFIATNGIVECIVNRSFWANQIAGV